MFFLRKINKLIKQKTSSKAGFTLVEMMVSIVIFSLAMTIAAQLFFYSLKMQRQMTARTKLINELAYSTERISRGIRMAQKETAAAGGCIGQYENYQRTVDSFGDRLKFLTPDTSFVSASPVDCVEYYLGHPADYPTGVVALMESRHNNGGAFADYALPLTSPAVDIQSFAVTERGWSQDDTYQPRVTLHLKALDAEGQEMEVQMTVSQRNIDIRY